MKIIEIIHTESVSPALNFNTYNIKVTMRASLEDTDDMDEAKKRLQEESRDYIESVISQSLPVFIKMCGELEQVKKKI
jgi:hypothetical protein